MGEVYRARDVNLGRDVAIKILPDAFATDSDRLARFDREAKTLASFESPQYRHGLETAHGSAGPGTDFRALVMELVDGPTLADRIAEGPLSLEEPLGIGKQIADALDAAPAHRRRQLTGDRREIVAPGVAEVIPGGFDGSVSRPERLHELP